MGNKIKEKCSDIFYNFRQEVVRLYKEVSHCIREGWEKTDYRLFERGRRQRRHQKAMSSFPRPPFSHKVFDSWKIPQRTDKIDF